MILGVTGCPGSGKSVLAAAMAERGWTLIDADRVGKEVVERDPPMLGELARTFGADILGPEGTLDRRLLARRAFSSPENTRLLNGVVHPVLVRRILGLIELRRTSGENVVVDCALIYEWGIERNFDRVLCVRADEDMRRCRLASRDGRSPEEIDRLFASQFPEREKVLRADIVLANNGTRKELAAYGFMLAGLPYFLRESGSWEK
jgi:dephospho-CoA kinase